jgi:hypothetical protein
VRVYGIGGLGVDERAFCELTLDFELTPLNWIAAKPKETMQDYALRFSKSIDTSEPFAIIGISFGGMMALELSKIIDPQKIVLISSATSKKDIPLIYRLYGRAGLFNVTPNLFMKPTPLLSHFFFGVCENRHQKILKEIITDTDHDFLRWASNQIARWDNRHVPDNVLRLHGSADRLLGYPKTERVTVIPKAGHCMVMSRAKELSDILNREFGDS